MAAVPPVHVPNELRYRRDRVRLTVLVFRKEGMSTEEFQKYWRDQHSQCFAHLKIVKKNLLKYEQGHTTEEVVEQLKGVSFPTLACDGMAIFEAATFEKIFEVFQDKEYIDTVIPDEEKFLDRNKSQAVPSTLATIFDEPS